MRSLGRLLMLATLITGAIVIVLPAVANADARVSTQVPCVSSVGGNVYSGSGTNVITAGGGVILPGGSHLQFARTTSGFAMTAGGGIDFRLSKNVYLRPIQAEYFLTRLRPIAQLDTVNRNNFRYSAGINFEFGHPK